MREHKGQNQGVIEWFQRAEPNQSFIKTPERDLSYGLLVDELTKRSNRGAVTVRPNLDIDGVLGVLSAMIGGGAVVVGHDFVTRSIDSSEGAALVMFTSGTSGPPKGVRLTLENIEAACQASMAHLGHDQTDTWLVALPLHHVGGLSAVVRSGYAGGAIRLQPGFDPHEFTMAMHGDVTLVSVVPTMLHRLLRQDPGPYRDLRAVLVGGGPIPSGLLEKAAEAGLPVLPTYGMTETFGQVATLKPGSPMAYKAHPLPGVDLRIEQGGRIALRSNQISPGYLGEADRTDPWFTTSDLGSIDSEGALRVEGRADAVIVTGGEKVNPEAVESIVAECAGVSDAAILGLPDDEWGSVVVCLYAGTARDGEIRSFLEGRMPRYMIPRRWVVVDALPRGDMGKLDQAAAKRLAASG